MSRVAFPRVGSVVEEVEAKFNQTTLAKAASESGVLVVNTRVNHRYANSRTQVALLAQLVNSSHDVWVVVAFVTRRVTASETVRGRTMANGCAVADTRKGALRLVQLPHRGDLFDHRPRGDLLDNGTLVLRVV
jgi:hypothetical protein